MPDFSATCSAAFDGVRKSVEGKKLPAEHAEEHGNKVEQASCLFSPIEDVQRLLKPG